MLLAKGDGIFFNGTPRTISEEGYNSCSTTMLPGGSILFSSRAPIGHCAVAAYSVCTNQGLKSIVPSNDLDSIYGYYALRRFTEDISKMGRGATFDEETKEMMEGFAIPLPPLTEQRRIAAILRAADEERRRRRYTQSLSDGLLREVFVRMFGDPATNPMGWEAKPLAHFVRSGDKINYGVVQPGDDYPGGAPIVRVGDFDDLDWTTDHLKRIDPSIEVGYRLSRLKGYEILVACVGSIGKIALADDRLKGYNIVRAVARVPAAESIDRAYLAQYLRMEAAQLYFRDETRTVSQPTLNIEQIELLPVHVPPLELQRKFGVISARFDHVRRQQQESARQADHLFDTLLHRAFAGEL